MSRIGDLLFAAAQHLATMSNPATLPDGEAALEAVRGFMAVEAEIYALPEAYQELSAFIMEPLDPTGVRVNHAMLAGLVMSRSGWPASATALLQAAKQRDAWVAAQARLNLAWLAETPENAEALAQALAENADEKDNAIPAAVLVEALIHQKAPDRLAVILACLDDRLDEAGRARAFTALVDLMPEVGLTEATNRAGIASTTGLTALGLLAVYQSEEAYRQLLLAAPQADSDKAVRWRWLGRIPRPESLPPLLQGLQHPEVMVRLNVVTSLGLFGSQEAWGAVIDSLADPAKEVSDQAMALLFDWLGQELWSFSQSWSFDEQGSLDTASRRRLQEITVDYVRHLAPDLCYRRGELLLLAQNLEDLYRGFLPSHVWYHWVAMTGAYGSYDPHKVVLYNYPTLERLEDWHIANGSRFQAGRMYYHGNPCTRGSVGNH